MVTVITVQQVLGPGKVEEACNSFELNQEDREVVNEVLRRWAEEGLNSRGQFQKLDKKIDIMMEVVKKDDPNRGNICYILITLNADFVVAMSSL